MEEVRLRDRHATRQRIMAAARDLFAEHGYDQVTMRIIAARAEANLSLINRYFGSKRELFAEVIAQQGRFPGVLDEAGGDLPRALAEYVADRLTSPGDSVLVATLARSAPSAEIQEILRERIRTAILEPLRERLPGDDAELRAALATALIMGSAQLRRVFGPAGEWRREAVVERLTQVFRACLC
ncbi:TetR/AcrR family transcriptional regulator [Nonomuraea africana]|uniref:AcrR family transcriptional regulator n=1 Tax=Nonomuraea africana TaxID=46171 RepID=A0ABR9K918_9ACTN|nr:TetR/AcrR family transcriptional regulator [Nonomuraea africana]MBE1558503.1 AcrR family transcriptional regulator [Nonomuraea africana]